MKIPFILRTSQETKPENYDLAATVGVDDFLSKPLDWPTIRLRPAKSNRDRGGKGRFYRHSGINFRRSVTC